MTKKKFLVEISIDDRNDSQKSAIQTSLASLNELGIEAKIIEALPILFAEFEGGNDPEIMAFIDYKESISALYSLYKERFPEGEDEEGNKVEFSENFFSSSEVLGKVDMCQIR